MTPEGFREAVGAAFALELSDQQMAQYAKYLKILQAWNQKMNLTAITTAEEVYLKHFYDSLSLVNIYPLADAVGIKLLDVGAGAGFPSIPLKIAYPHIEVVIIDSLKKRIAFLEHLISALGLENVQAHHARAEVFGQEETQREQYPLVTARAVANLAVLAEFCLPLVALEGDFIAMKGSQGQAEQSEAKGALKMLGGEIIATKRFTLPEDEGERYLLRIKKVKKTPKKYPRQAGIPSKKPLK